MRLAALSTILVLAIGTAWSAPAAEELVPEKGLDTGFARAYVFAWSPNGKRLACGSDTGVIGIWDWPSLQLLKTLRGHTAGIGCLSWHSDSLRLASGAQDPDISIWDTAAGRQIAKISTPFGFATWRPDGKRLAVDVGNGFGIFGAELDKPVLTLGFEKAGVGFEWRGDGKEALSIGLTGEEAPPSEIRIWNVEAGLVSRTLPIAGARLQQASWSPDGRRIATLDRDRVARILDAKSGDVAQVLEGSEPPPTNVSWCPSGDQLAGSARDGTLRIWSAKNGKLRNVMRTRGRWPMVPKWSPDGTWVAGGGVSGQISFWRVGRMAL